MEPTRLRSRLVGLFGQTEKDERNQVDSTYVNGGGMDRKTFTQLEQLPNIGPAIAGKLQRIGIRTPEDLVGRNPYTMFKEFESLTGEHCDPCLLDVFISAVQFMAGSPKKPWWAYTAERKKMLAEEDQKNAWKGDAI